MCSFCEKLRHLSASFVFFHWKIRKNQPSHRISSSFSFRLSRFIAYSFSSLLLLFQMSHNRWVWPVVSPLYTSHPCLIMCLHAAGKIVCPAGIKRFRHLTFYNVLYNSWILLLISFIFSLFLLLFFKIRIIFYFNSWAESLQILSYTLSEEFQNFSNWNWCFFNLSAKLLCLSKSRL